MLAANEKWLGRNGLVDLTDQASGTLLLAGSIFETAESKDASGHSPLRLAQAGRRGEAALGAPRHRLLTGTRPRGPDRISDRSSEMRRIGAHERHASPRAA